VIWTGVFQYCFIRVFMTVTAVVTQVLGRYCLESLNPVFAHIWVMGIEAVAVTIAMYSIIQFYLQVRKDIAQHSPLLKVLAIKLVIFLSFWQTIVISLLTGSGIIKPSPKFKTPDIKVGIPSLLLCIEMAFFAFFHLFAFSWRDYTTNSKVYQQEMAAGETPAKYQGGFLGIKAIAEAANPWDIIKAVARAGRWLFVGHRKRMLDSSYSVSRTDTDETMSRDPTAYSNTKLNPLNGSTTYASAKPGMRGAKIDGYNLEEDQQPLVHGQPAPFSDAPPGRDHSPYSLAGTESREAGDIGVGNSQFEEYDDWPRGQPGGQGPPAIHVRAPSGQETGVVPYPDERGQQSQPVPYFDPPPSDSRKGRR
jgi:Organic solute transporter Ostalpha